MESLFSWQTVVITTLLVWAIEAILARIERKYDCGIGAKRRMTFWTNWAVSIGIPIFAVVNGLVVNLIVNSNLPWYAYVFSLAIGCFITRELYRDWSKYKEQNSGHIIDESGDVIPAGDLHAIYLVLQIATMLLFLIVPAPTGVAFGVGFLVSVFFVIQTVQADVIQGSVNWGLSILCLAGTVVVTVLKFFQVF